MSRSKQATDAQEAAVTAALAVDREGMLRDMFTASVLGAMIASAPIVDRSYIDKRTWCHVALRWADEMMSARKSTPEQVHAYLKHRGL